MLRAENDGSDLLVLIVTCSKSPPERLVSVSKELAALNLSLKFEIVDGCIATDASVDEIYDPRRNNIRMKRPLSRIEIAVYASHRLAWQRLIDSDYAAALVFEDDFTIDDPDVVKSIILRWGDVLGEGRDIVKLFDFEKRKENRAVREAKAGDVNLVKWASPSAGMVSYVISRDGAQKFLSRQKVFRQVDEDIKYFWELGLNIWSVRQNPVSEISHKLGGSLVEFDRKKIRKRSLLRSFWGNLLAVDRKLRTRLYFALEGFRISVGRHRP